MSRAYPLACALVGVGVVLTLVGAATHLAVGIAGAVLTAVGAVGVIVTGGSR